MATLNNRGLWYQQQKQQNEAAANQALKQMQQGQPAQAQHAVQPQQVNPYSYAKELPKATPQPNAGVNTEYGYTPSAAVTQAKQYLEALQNNRPGEYTSRYQDQLQGLLDKITNRGEFSYDANADPLYQIYKDIYITNGQRAMQDTMGQAAALTGGYGNSYAQSVGQQAYNQYMENLNAIIPELQQQAYQRYADEGDRLAQNYAMLNQAENQDYNRYRDVFDDWQTERQQAENRLNNERNFDYAAFGDKRDYDLSVDQFNRNMALQEAQFDYSKEADLRDYLAQMDQYNRNMALQEAQFDYSKEADLRDYLAQMDQFNRNYDFQQQQFDYSKEADLRDYNAQMDQFNRNFDFQNRQFDYTRESDLRDYQFQVEQANRAYEMQQAQLALQQAQFDWQKQQAAAKSSGGGSGKSGSSSKSTAQPTATAAAAAAAAAQQAANSKLGNTPYNLVNGKPSLMTAREYAQVDPLQSLYANMDPLVSSGTMDKRYTDYAENAIMQMHQSGQISDAEALRMANQLEAENKAAQLLNIVKNKGKSTITAQTTDKKKRY